MYKLILFFSTVWILHISCQESSAYKKQNHSSVTINVQPFSDIPAEEAKYVVSEISKVYPYVSLKYAMPLPQSAYYASRKRYRADSLIRFLSNITPPGCVTIGLTSKDISTSKDSIADWGVMGLGFCPGKACIASTFRLSKSEKLMQLFKVAIHELGHTQGLPHCSVKTCFMRDAEGHNPTNDEKDFCVTCKKLLISKGWHFN